MNKAHIQAAYIVWPYITLCKSFITAATTAWYVWRTSQWGYMWVLALGLALAGWIMQNTARAILEAVS